jgi:chromosome segregation ATPase
MTEKRFATCDTQRWEGSKMNSKITTAENNAIEPGYLDTLALLQEEIARLEEEVRQRDEALAESEHASAQLLPESNPAEAARNIELSTELAQREETIIFLLEEIRLVGEAETAGRAEWEQLNQWVELVEHRVDARAEQDLNLARELDSERRNVEEVRVAADADRRAWDKQRKDLEEEVERLRPKFSTVNNQTNSQTKRALESLEAENRRLRKACDNLTHATASGPEFEAVRAQLASSESLLKEARTDLVRIQDDRLSERNEHEAALSTLRTQVACDQLRTREEVDGSAANAIPPSAGPEPSIDERIRAFRQHLHDVHQRELEERSQKRFSARLARLWRRTGPSG